MLDFITNFFDGVFTSLWNFLQSIINFVSDPFTGIFSLVVRVSSPLINGILNLTGITSSDVQNFTGIANSFIDNVCESISFVVSYTGFTPFYVLIITRILFFLITIPLVVLPIKLFIKWFRALK